MTSLFVLHQTLSHHFTDTYGGHEYMQYIVLKNSKEVVWRKKRRARNQKTEICGYLSVKARRMPETTLSPLHFKRKLDKL